ncbi:hypothetical protein QR680_010356 [Steinernema hermaphroditum]|uniref:Uncharacterized protein n=1 Tax=Steinernema hermaphroditum TaxID=289476 RepID=A0AA39INP8_9BILA|nr:hypothetical protein QR680_010356 [Steinernema hermaphroditum]
MSSEKQVINALVAKVREVVHDVSNNDIILVLHNYEMDVQKTIQALCEDRENALGSWEHTGGATKKKSQKKKAKKAAKAAAAAETSSTNGGASPSSSTPVSTPTPVVSKPVPVKFVARVPEAAKVEKKAAPSQNLDLDQHSANLDQVSASFDRQVSQAESHLRNIFDYIRECVDNREKELQKQLRRVRSDGNQYISSRQKQLDALKAKPSEESLKEFVAGIPAQTAFGEAERFFFEADTVLDPLREMGEVVAVKASSSAAAPAKPVEAPVAKKAAQPVSNGVAPAPKAAAPEAPKAAPKKVEAVVNDGGFVMGSDGLSAEALADIHAMLQANLKAQGVDLTVVENLTNGGFCAPRRRPNNGNANPKVAKGGRPVKA